MSIFSGILFLGIAMFFQITIVSQIHLLQGSADLVLLTLLSWSLTERVEVTWEWALIAGLLVGAVSAIPIWAPIAAYIFIAFMVSYIKRRVWQVPILAIFTATTLGTLIIQFLSFIALSLNGVQLEFFQVFNLITLPSLLLNLLVVIPVKGITGEISRWILPDEIE